MYVEVETRPFDTAHWGILNLTSGQFVAYFTDWRAAQEYIEWLNK